MKKILFSQFPRTGCVLHTVLVILFSTSNLVALENQEMVTEELYKVVEEAVGIRNTNSSQVEIATRLLDLQKELPFDEWYSFAKDVFEKYGPSPSQPLNRSYNVLTGIFTPILRNNYLPKLHIIWNDILTVDVPSGWKMFVIWTVPQFVLSVEFKESDKHQAEKVIKLESATILNDLIKLCKQNQYPGVYTTAIARTQTIITELKDRISNEVRDECILSIMDLIESQVTRARDGKRANAPESLPVVISGLRMFYKLLRYNVINKSTIQSRILSLEDDMQFFDASCCIELIRLVKLGLNRTPSETMFEIAKEKIIDSSQREELDYLEKY